MFMIVMLGGKAKAIFDSKMFASKAVSVTPYEAPFTNSGKLGALGSFSSTKFGTVDELITNAFAFGLLTTCR